MEVVLPGSFVNTLQTVFVVSHFLRLLNPLDDSTICGLVCLCMCGINAVALAAFEFCCSS